MLLSLFHSEAAQGNPAGASPIEKLDLDDAFNNTHIHPDYLNERFAGAKCVQV